MVFEKLMSLIDSLNSFLSFLVENGFKKEEININIWIKPNRSVYSSGFYYQVIKTVVYFDHILLLFIFLLIEF